MAENTNDARYQGTNKTICYFLSFPRTPIFAAFFQNSEFSEKNAKSITLTPYFDSDL